MRPTLIAIALCALLNATAPAQEPQARPDPETTAEGAAGDDPEARVQEPAVDTPAGPPTERRRPSVTALVGGTIIPGDGSAPIEDGVVIVGARRISAVGTRGGIAIPEDATVIDTTGKWIVPGLIDGHVHFFQSGSLYTRPDVIDLRDIKPYEEDVAASRAGLSTTFDRYLAAGVTSVFDPGGPLWTFDVRELADGARAPRVAVAGPLIATEPTPRQKRLIIDSDQPIISATDAAEAQSLAEALLPEEPDAIKIWGIGSDAEGAARIEAITRAVKEVAASAGIRVAVHATTLANAKAAVRGGADILVHSVFDRAVDKEFIRLLKDGNVTYITTIVVQEGYEDTFAGDPELSVEERRLADPEVLNSLFEVPLAMRRPRSDAAEEQAVAMENARRLFDAGVRVAIGTDAGNIGTLHGGSIHRELEILEQAGIDPLDIITIATRNAAYALTPNPDFGTLRQGFAADFLVLTANPLEDVGNLARIETVWRGGRDIPRQELIPKTPAAVVQAQLAAYNRQDIEAFASAYADDIKIYNLPRTSSPEISGKDDLKERYGRLFDRPDSEKVRCDVVGRIMEASFVIHQERCRGLDGREIKGRATAIYEVKDGKIRRVWFAG